MLASEEARARLEATADMGWRDDALARAAALPGPQRAAAEPFLQTTDFIADDDERAARDAALATAAEALDAMADEDRLVAMTALHPELGADLAAWWVAAQAAPYTSGGERRAYRVPGHPAETRAHRRWILHDGLSHLGPLRHDAVWLAGWSGHVGMQTYGFSTFAYYLGGPLLAAALDREDAAGERAVLDELLAVVAGDHPIGGIDRSTIIALLGCARPEAWGAVERLLLAAGAHEGLRQVILEAADEGHLASFARLLDVVIDHDLLRFAAAMRAAGVWIGFLPDATQPGDIATHVTRLRGFVVDPATRAPAVATGEPWAVYTALVAEAMGDVHAGLDLVATALARPETDVRAAAVRFLGTAQVCRAHDLLIEATGDPEVVVAALAAEALPTWTDEPSRHGHVFEAYEALIERLPTKARSVDDVGVELGPVPLDRSLVAHSMVGVLGGRALDRLLPWLPAMGPRSRAAFAIEAGGRQRLTDDVRAALLKLVGDRSPDVRQLAVRAMERLALAPGDAESLEPLLTRKAGDLRSGVIALLGTQPVDDVVRSAERLWARGGEGPRDAAAELLGAVGDPTQAVVEAARALLDDRPSDRQREALEAVLRSEADDGEDDADPWDGLLDEGARTPPTPPRPDRGRLFAGDAAHRLVHALDDLAEAHRDTVVTVTVGAHRNESLLADLRFLPHPVAGAADGSDGGLVLADIFRPWWEDRPADLRHAEGDDGLDALRALAVLSATMQGRSEWDRDGAAGWLIGLWAEAVGGGPGELRHRVVIAHVLQWALITHAGPAVVDEGLDALEATLAAIPPERHAPLVSDRRSRTDDWRVVHGQDHPWHLALEWLLRSHPRLFDAARLRRWLGLLRWVDQPTPEASPDRPSATVVARAHALGVATDADMAHALVHDHFTFRRWTVRRRQAALDAFPAGVAVVDRLRARALELELHRGDLPTAGTRLARNLPCIEGADVALELLRRLGRATLVRGPMGDDESREASYSHLLRVSFPAPGDTAATVAETAERLGLADVRLVELALFAPQWTALVEEATGWEGLADAIWWYHAHTKDERWSVDRDVRETWELLAAERTALGSEDLLAGAVDVAWFARARAALGAERWAVVHDAAKLASGGNGHTRAKLYAEALLGTVDADRLRARALEKRHQDSIRALGLLPLPEDPAAARDVALARYRDLREVERGAARFGAQRRDSERTAVRIGIENLARTAGAADPQRFAWAMEAAETSDLAGGPVTVAEDDVTVTLAIDDDGVPQLAVERAGTPLKAVPAKVKKAPAIAALVERRTVLDRQAGRVRSALEAAMIGRDLFSDEDVGGLRQHPLVAPLLARLVFVDEAGRTMRPARDGAWHGVDGAPIEPDGERRIAHPIDLAAGGGWPAWQERLVVDEVRQPFKQVFRELYVLTDAERDEGSGSRRWEGHQVQPRQALALFGARGWVADRDGGEVVRVFHGDDLVARVGFLDGFGTPGDVELPTIEQVRFTRRGAHRPLPLDEVPAVVFSEAMRDLDLVVSVAHAGGVDPETSASTIEMRAALVRETARLLKLGNVRHVSRHVVIEGGLGEYSVHLGSGTIHRRPGGAVCIIPVDAQRRGRIFLPFADDDPKTAEVVAKVLLLARDTEIRDPTILEQLRS